MTTVITGYSGAFEEPTLYGEVSTFY